MRLGSGSMVRHTLRFLFTSPPSSSTTRYPHKLRSKEFPGGLHDLHGRGLEVMNIGNRLAEFAEEITEMARARHIPAGEDNPGSSYLWQLHSRQSRLDRPEASFVLFDQCAFRTPWKKRTGVLTCWWATPSLEHRCCAHGRVCSYSKKPHVVLSGTQNGQFMTLRGSKYPLQLARALAADFQTAYIRGEARALQISFSCIGQPESQG